MGSNIQEQLELLIQATVQKKDDEIKTLRETNEKLREENEKLLKQIGGGGGDIKQKAESLKKALDDFLEHPNSNRTTYHQRQHIPPYNSPSVFIPGASQIPAIPSTSTRPDEPSVNGEAKYNSNRNFNHEDFSSRQDFRKVTDVEIVNQANPTDQHHFYSQYNGNNSQKRFNPNASSFTNGINNNNNNRNNRINNNNNSNKYTIFVSWPGTATKEQLQDFFDKESIDVADIRYTAQKQFAHVDLKSESALNKAIQLHGMHKEKLGGTLRVEPGKPRSSNPNPTENGQRPQNQNKNFSRQNNKNLNGYNNNTSSPQKQNKFPYHNNNHHNNNHHVGLSSFVTTTDDKENNNNSWQPSEIPKSESN